MDVDAEAVAGAVDEIRAIAGVGDDAARGGVDLLAPDAGPRRRERRVHRLLDDGVDLAVVLGRAGRPAMRVMSLGKPPLRPPMSMTMASPALSYAIRCGDAGRRRCRRSRRWRTAGPRRRGEALADDASDFELAHPRLDAAKAVCMARSAMPRVHRARRTRPRPCAAQLAQRLVGEGCAGVGQRVEQQQREIGAHGLVERDASALRWRRSRQRRPSASSGPRHPPSCGMRGRCASRGPSALSAGIRNAAFSRPTSIRHGRSSGCGWKPSSQSICDPGPIATRSAPCSRIFARSAASLCLVSTFILQPFNCYLRCLSPASVNVPPTSVATRMSCSPSLALLFD